MRFSFFMQNLTFGSQESILGMTGLLWGALWSKFLFAPEAFCSVLFLCFILQLQMLFFFYLEASNSAWSFVFLVTCSFKIGFVGVFCSFYGRHKLLFWILSKPWNWRIDLWCWNLNGIVDSILLCTRYVSVCMWILYHALWFYNLQLPYNNSDQT